MAIAIVKTLAELTFSGTNSGNITDTVTAGSAIVFIGANTNSGTLTITDNQGNTWVEDKTKSSAASGDRVTIGHALSVAGASTTFTATYSGASTTASVRFLELSGMATSSPVDVSGSNANDTTSNPTATPSPGLTTADADLMVIAYCADRDISAATFAAGWTSLSTSRTSFRFARQIFTGTTSGERGALSGVAMNYDAAIVGYLPAAGGATPTGYLNLPLLGVG